MSKELTLEQVVLDRLHEMFVQIADDIALLELAVPLTEEQAAGIPFALFSAEQEMRHAFICLVRGKTTQGEQK